MITAGNRKELLMLAGESSLKKDLRYLAANRHNPLMVNGRVEMDRLIQFLQEFNEFLNHKPKEFRPIPDHKMRL